VLSVIRFVLLLETRSLYWLGYPMRTGYAQLPLHGGKAPAWLFSRMVRLSRELLGHLVEEHGPDEVLRRLSDPFWFQALGCVLGFDWHSSGVTTTVTGALKEAMRGRERDFGLLAAGGKGAVSRRTPAEVTSACDKLSRDPAPLVHASRTTAKVDSAAVQDGYQLYHHAFFFTPAGGWCVVQQGMSDATRTARRYHWLSESVASFVNEPHAAVCCDARSTVLNLVAGESAAVRTASAELARRPPAETIAALDRLPELVMPHHHDVRGADIDRRYLQKVLLRTYERAPEDFETLLGVPGVGAKTLRALALASELVYGTRASTRDPARFSFAHGGKDGHPYPVDRETYDRTIEVLGAAVRRARVGETDRVQALQRLAAFAAQPARPSSSSSAASDRRNISS
jgi:hypothetical protein